MMPSMIQHRSMAFPKASLLTAYSRWQETWRNGVRTGIGTMPIVYTPLAT